MSTIGFFRKDDPVGISAANLPHWRQEGVTYFSTFRTADSLPQGKLQQWLNEKAEWLAAHPEPWDEQTVFEYYKCFPERIEYWLDQDCGACLLRQPAVCKLVENALKFFDGQRYVLDEYAIAGNHVHALVTPKGEHTLSGIIHSWKSFTANEINIRLRLSGPFWQKESFDHIIRSEAQLERIRSYIRQHTKRPEIGWDNGDCAPLPFHTTGHAVFRIRRLNSTGSCDRLNAPRHNETIFGQGLIVQRFMHQR
ncbi:MAG: transposase [Lentisphaeria bacterium]|jgi:REP element-mobilizing transposase RayT